MHHATCSLHSLSCYVLCTWFLNSPNFVFIYTCPNLPFSTRSSPKPFVFFLLSSHSVIYDSSSFSLPYPTILLQPCTDFLCISLPYALSHLIHLLFPITVLSHHSHLTFHRLIPLPYLNAASLPFIIYHPIFQASPRLTLNSSLIISQPNTLPP